MSESLRQEEAVTAFVSNVLRQGITRDEVAATYKAWANSYDNDMKTYGRKTPEVTLAPFFRRETNKEFVILDLAAGTGVIGAMLRKSGFTTIDAYDGNREMLELAKARNVYRNIYCQYIGSDKSEGIKDDTYDVVVCVGSFSPGHLDEKCLVEIIRMLKLGGRFYFNRLTFLDDKVQKELEKLQDEKKCKVIEQDIVKKVYKHGDSYVYVIQKV